MSRTIFALSLCALASNSVADDQLLPTPDPAFSAAGPCDAEQAAVNNAHAELADASIDFLEAVAHAEEAQENLDDCLSMGGSCSQEQADLDLAHLAVDATQTAWDAATEAVDNAEAELDECLCNAGGNGPGDPPEPDPFPPAYAIMSDKGLSGVVMLLVSP